MKLTVVGPMDHGGFDVHKTHCADLQQVKYRPYGLQMYKEEHPDRRSVVESFYGPSAGSFYEEQWGDDIPEDAWTHYADEFYFYPCCQLLPRETS